MALDWLPQRLYVGKECSFIVPGATDLKAKSIKVKLQSLINRSVVKGIVVPLDTSGYRVLVTPTIRGRHELNVLINGSPLDGSPWALFVYYDPAQLGPLVKEFLCDAMSCPQSVAVSPDKVYVTNHLAQQVVVFDRGGKRLMTLGGPGKFPFAASDHGCPQYIATDSVGSIYVTTRNCKLVKIDAAGEVLMSIRSSGDQLQQFGSLWGVKVHMGKVYVCDPDNNRVQVFDLNLALTGVLTRDGTCEMMSKPYDLAFDSSGTMYVASTGCIHVLSREDHRCVKHFGIVDDAGEGAIMFPYGLAVFGDHVFVSEHYEHHISIFNTSGRYVGRLGRYGSERGEFQHPWGIDVDSDGFVYVCNSIRCCIQVY